MNDLQPPENVVEVHSKEEADQVNRILNQQKPNEGHGAATGGLSADDMDRAQLEKAEIKARRIQEMMERDTNREEL